MNFRTLAGTLAALSLLACRRTPDDTEELQPVDTDVESDTSTDTDTEEPDNDTDVADTDVAGECTHNGFTQVAQDAGGFSGFFTYIAQSTLGAPVDVLSFILDPNQGGATEAGTYAITDANYKTCANCIIIYQGCDKYLDNCAKTFLANTGSLVISEFGDTGGRFTGKLNGAEFIEVTLADDATSTPVVDGETWCLDDYSFDALVQ